MDPLRHEGKVKNKRRKKLQNGREQWARKLNDNELQVKAFNTPGSVAHLASRTTQKVGTMSIWSSITEPFLKPSWSGSQRSRREERGFGRHLSPTPRRLRSKRQLSKSFTVVISPLSTRLIKPNFCYAGYGLVNTT